MAAPPKYPRSAHQQQLADAHQQRLELIADQIATGELRVFNLAEVSDVDRERYLRRRPVRVEPEIDG